MVEELEPLVKERLEVDVLPLQGLDACVVVVAVVEDQVLCRVAEVATVGAGALIGTQTENKNTSMTRNQSLSEKYSPFFLLLTGDRLGDLAAVVAEGQVVDQAVPVLLPLVRALGGWQGADKLGGDRGHRGGGGGGH